MFLLTPKGHSFVASIVLRNGTVAGEGRADTRANAQYFACLDAIHNGYPQAAMGHATMLSIRDENSVRAAAFDASRASANPLHLPRLPHLKVSPTTKNRLVAGGLVAAGVGLLYWLYKAPAPPALSPAQIAAAAQQAAAANALKNAGI